MSPTRHRKARLLGVLAAAVVVAAAVVAALIVAPRLADDSAAQGSGENPAGSTPAAGAAATSSAPYTIGPEPTEVATDAPLTTTSGQVAVVLSYAGFDGATDTVQANGLVIGVIEEGGTCTLTLTNGGSVVTATSSAAADATTTTCGLVQTAPGIASGTWVAVLQYASADAHGTSESLEVVVP